MHRLILLMIFILGITSNAWAHEEEEMPSTMSEQLIKGRKVTSYPVDESPQVEEEDENQDSVKEQLKQKKKEEKIKKGKKSDRHDDSGLYRGEKKRRKVIDRNKASSRTSPRPHKKISDSNRGQSRKVFGAKARTQEEVKKTRLIPKAFGPKLNFDPDEREFKEDGDVEPKRSRFVY